MSNARADDEYSNEGSQGSCEEELAGAGFHPASSKSGRTVSAETHDTINKTRLLMSFGHTKKFVFGSEFFWLPEGIKTLNGAFQNDLALKSLEAKLAWNPQDATFRLSCRHAVSEQVWGIFFKNIKDLITQESRYCAEDSCDSGSDLDEDEEGSGDDEVKPTTSNKIQRLPTWKKQNTIAVNGDEVDTASEQDSNDQFPEKVRYYKTRLVWNHDAAKPLLEEIAPDELLIKLEKLTGCGFFKDLNKSKIFVGAFSPSEGRVAVCKLDNIRKSWNLHCPFSRHVFYTGEIENYQVSFKEIGRMKQKFFETTLLDNLLLSGAMFNYRNLPFAVMVRCSTFNSVKSRFMPLKSVVHAAVDLDNKHSGPREWQSFEYNHNIPGGREDCNSMSRYLQQTTQQPEAPSSIQKTEKTSIDAGRLESPVKFQVQSAPPADNPTPQLIPGQEASQINILDEDNAILGVAVLQPTQRPAFSEVMQRFSEPESRRYHATMNQKAPKTMPKSKQKGTKTFTYAGRLEQPSPPPVRASVQSAPPANDPTPQFIEGIATGFNELVESLRGFHGELKVQAEFGRILLRNVHRKHISSQESSNSLDPEEAVAYLETAAVPVFTKVLTVLPADISYLVEMENSRKNFIWKQEIHKWEVVYQVICVDSRPGRKRQPFTIEVDGERFTSRVKVRRDFGAINVHGVKQSWDFRIAATGAEAEENIDPAYTEFAKVVTDSIHIPKGLAIPMLFFEIPHSFRDFAVFGVRSRRVAQYENSHGNSALNISEVRELQMFDAPGDGCTIWKAVACLEPDTRLSAQGHKFFYLWHEVSITCPEADEMFQQNKTLELGEETLWDTKQLSAIHTVQSMYLPACEMLKQMDGVGFYNDNDIDPSVELRRTTAESEKRPAPYFFW